MVSGMLEWPILVVHLIVPIVTTSSHPTSSNGATGGRNTPATRTRNSMGNSFDWLARAVFASGALRAQGICLVDPTLTHLPVEILPDLVRRAVDQFAP
jgi:hypothetical protein